MGKIKLVSLDLDYTLINSHHLLSTEHIPFLQEISKECIVVFASGRPLPAMLPTARSFGPGVVSYFISNNGSYSVDRMGEVFFESTLDKQLVLQMINDAKKMGVHPHFYGDEEIIAFYESAFTDRDSVVTGLPIRYEMNVEKSVHSRDVHKLIVMGEPVRMAHFFDHVKSYDEINPILAKPYFGEIPAKGVDKGTVLKRLIDHLGIREEEVIAVGDSQNDIGMIELAGYGFAMDNAGLLVKQASDYVFKINNDENLCEVLHQLIKSDMDPALIDYWTYHWSEK